MALTVGIPTAVATQLVLDGKIKSKGVCMPNEKEIYEPMLHELTRINIYC